MHTTGAFNQGTPTGWMEGEDGVDTTAKPIGVCHVTSAHPRHDARIFHKQCRSLAKAGYDVTLVVHDPFPDAQLDGVRILSTGRSSRNRYARMAASRRWVLDKALSVDAAIYHLHDPELLPLIRILKSRGKTVIFDSHEDYLSTMGVKRWIPRFLRPLVQWGYAAYERRALSHVDAAVVCYPWTEARFQQMVPLVRMILNFPLLEPRFMDVKPDFTAKAVAFAGGISRQWHHANILRALTQVGDVTYELAGRLVGSYGQELQAMDGWTHVHHHGMLPLADVYTQVYGQSMAGLALLDYIPQCKGTVGNLSNTKFFEYMAVGLPLICTDFDMWKAVVEAEACGICVNPQDVDAIAAAIVWIRDHPQAAQAMGERGRQAVQIRYHWGIEEAKLLDMYRMLSGREGS